MSEHTQLCEDYEANIERARARKSRIRRAAPDMLLALEAIVRDIPTHAHDCSISLGDPCDCCMGKVRAALTKAKGTQP